MDESEFELSINAPEGASLAGMLVVLAKIEKELFSFPGVEHILVTVQPLFMHERGNLVA